MNNPQVISILVAEDDEEDRMLLMDAMQEGRLRNSMTFVHDGEQLLDYLAGRGVYEDRKTYPMPGLILLDLNLPRIDGREALKVIKEHIQWRRIPVIILTTSQAEQDILKSYHLGVNSFITKPVTFDGLVEVTRTLQRYWFEIVALPKQGLE
ncbi:MAG: response regulator [Bacteroidota bacterium]